MTESLAVDGLALEARWVGPPRDGGVELVFLHEGLGSITQWRDTPEAIARACNRPALVYARQGYGQSSPVAVPRPLTYMHDEAARLPRVLAAAGIREHVLIGHSDGASIALIAAGRGDCSPRAVVAIAPHVIVEDISVASIAQAADAYRTGELRAKLARHHADVDGAFWGWNRAWLDPEFRRWDIRGFLPSIRCPILAVQGTDDEYGTRTQVDLIASLSGGPVETHFVPGARHVPFRDAPAHVHAHISHYLDQLAFQFH